MTTSKRQPRPAASLLALAGVGFAALALSACGKASDQSSVPPATEASAANSPASVGTDATSGATVATAPAASLVVAAPTIQPPAPGTPVARDPNAAAEATADNAKVADLAKQFEADPAAIAQQNAICGPANQVVNNLYAVAHGVQSDELRRFRVACMAKDRAQREVNRKAANNGGGVQNKNSL